MAEYIVYDLSIPKDTNMEWTKEKEAECRITVKALRDYFTQLAKNEKVEDRVSINPSVSIGFAPPTIAVSMNDGVAKQLQDASKGRIFCGKIELH